jgi:hypothetical protein
MLDAAAANTDGFHSRDTCVSSTQLNRSIWNKETISTLKHRNSTMYSFQKLSLFSQGNNVLDAAASNINGYLWRDPCVSSSQPNGPIYSKQRLPPLSDA